MEQLDSLISLQEWQAALDHVHQHSLDPSYIPYLAQQQVLATCTTTLTPTILANLMPQIPDQEWVASACWQVSRTSGSLPLVQLAITLGKQATERVIASHDELAQVIEAEDVEGVRELSSLDEGVRKVCLIHKGLLELGDRVNTWQEIWAGEGEATTTTTAAKEKAKKEEEEDHDDEADDDTAAWGDLDVPPHSPKPDAEPSTAHSSSAPPSPLSSFLTDPLSLPALELAATASLPALLTLLKRHADILWPTRVDLLLSIPEWVEPAGYLPLLTGVGADGREVKWTSPSSSLFEPWRSTPEFLEKVFSAPPPTEEDEEDRRTSEEMTRFYRARIESVAEVGLVNVALGLVQHCASLDVQGLEEVGEELSLLSRLVYDRPSRSSTEEEEEEEPLTLATYRALPPSSIVALYLATSTPTTIASSIRHLVLPYLSVLESRLERAGTPDPSLPSRLLNEWILSLVSPPSSQALQKLEILVAIFEASKPTLPTPQRLVRDDEDLARLALSCLYTTSETSADALVLLGRIMECLPAFPSPSSPTPPLAAPSSAQTLFAALLPLPGPALAGLLDALDLHLSTAETFSRYGCPVPLSWFLSTRGDRVAQRRWAMRLARAGGGEGGEGEFEGEDEWVGLMESMLELCGEGRALHEVGREECLRVFFAGLLASGRISLARSLFSGSTSISLGDTSASTPPLEPGVVEELVIAASREFYDNAEDGNLHSGAEMKLAFECLSAAPQTPLIRKERDFIEATSRLCSYHLLSPSSGLPLTPIEIRLSPDRLGFIARLLAGNDEAYKHPEVLLELVEKLGVGGAEGRVRTLGMVGEAALARGEWGRAGEVGEWLVREVEGGGEQERGKDVVWRHCFQLGKQEDWEDVGGRLRSLGLALLHCPGERIASILPVWCALEGRGGVQAGRGREGEGEGAGRARPTSSTAGPPTSYLPPSQQQTHEPTVAGSRTLSRAAGAAAAFFPFHSSGGGPKGSLSLEREGVDSPERERVPSPKGSGEVERERERQHGLRAGLSSRLTGGMAWLIGADEEREREAMREG